MTTPIISINHISKRYRLGQIGGTTLHEELQRFSARLRHKEDPTRRIDARDFQKNETFMALDDVSFDVAPGERLGIIGRNGAGKSTLLKLISRITAPTEGWIGLNGRVASMLEVGTGFHGELTGRENVYLNGAILGMKKSEIDERLESIVEFSECSRFIDTPVKRYSSGMYVKLAFSVAAHLHSDIMIMDEVLAVGDVAFQKKCLEKMVAVSNTEGKTVLYVSHNMNTIRQLCDRCALLENGKLVYLGSVEEAIEKYTNVKNLQFSKDVDLVSLQRDDSKLTGKVRFVKLVLDSDDNLYAINSLIGLVFTLRSTGDFDNVKFQMILFSSDGRPIGKTESNAFFIRRGLSDIPIQIPLMGIAYGSYYYEIRIIQKIQSGEWVKSDCIPIALPFSIVYTKQLVMNPEKWYHQIWGHVMFKPIQLPTLEEQGEV